MVKEVLGYLHSHWDREWYKTFEEYHLRLVDVLDDIFKKLENNEINCFYLDGQTVALTDYLEICPEKTDYVKQLIKDKKLFVGPFYDLADEFLVNGESLCRNLAIGLKEAQKYNADFKDFIGYLPDAFGHSAWMPTIFKLAHIDKAIVWRGVGEAPQEFNWVAPNDDTIKTTFLKNGYYQDFFAQKSYKNNLNKLLENLQKNSVDNLPLLLPIGADHLGCEDNIKAKIKNFNRNNDKFKIKLASLKEYFERTNEKLNLQTVRGELRNNLNNYVLPSVASSRVYLKQRNMQLQWKLGKIVEPLFAFLSEQNKRFGKKEVFEYAWKLLIQNHAHDSICGCSLDAVHKENEIRFDKVEQICDGLIDNAIFNLAKEISKKEIGIMNLSNYDFDGVVSFYSDKKLDLPVVGKKKMFPVEISQDIHNIPIQENYKYYYEYLMPATINSMSLSVCSLEAIKKTNNILSVTKNSLENEFLKVKVNKDGTLNIKNKFLNKEFKNILRITDEADVGDSYTFSCIPDDKKLFASFKTSEVVEDNELRKILRLYYELNIPTHAKNDKERSKKLIKHNFVVDFILCAKSKRLDVKIEYENLSKDHILKLSFELPEIIEEVKSEDTFGVITRKFEPNYDYKNSLPAKEFTEINLNTAPFQRFVMTQGLCVLTKGLQEYEVEKNNLNITMLRSFGIIAKRRLITRAAAAGPPLPTPEGQCLGKQVAEFSILLSEDETEMMKEADFYYNPFVVIDGKSAKKKQQDTQFIKLPEKFYLYSAKIAEDGNGIIAKIFNLSNKSEQLKITDKKKIFETNLLEENLSDINFAQKEISFEPKELKIFRIAK